MKKFNEYFDQNQPSIRVGPRVPQNAVNLACVDAPQLDSQTTVELFDYSVAVGSTMISHAGYTDENMYVDGSKYLNDNGSYIVPSDNILVTNIFKQQGSDSVPLYYVFLARYYHFETNPPLDDNNIYLGETVKFLLGNTPTTLNHMIKLLPTDDPSVWNVLVYTDFTPNANNIFYLQYSKCLADETNKVFNFKEVFNPTPLFMKMDKNSVLSSPDGSPLFSADLVPGQEGYLITVPKSVDDADARRKLGLNNGSMILFRWSVGCTKNGVTTYLPWKAETLFSSNTNSIYQDEICQDMSNPIVGKYSPDRDARKILDLNIGAYWGNTQNASYSFSKQIWDWSKNAWVQDTNDVIEFDCAGMYINPNIGQIYSYPMLCAFVNLQGNNGNNAYINTGSIIQNEIGEFIENYPVSNGCITIEACASPSVVSAGAKYINWSKTSYGATVTPSVPSGFSTTSPLNCIDGVSSPLVWYQDGSYVIYSGTYTQGYYNGNWQGPYPPTSASTITVNFNGVKNIRDFDIVLGSTGQLNSVVLNRTTGGDVTIWANHNAVPSATLKGGSIFGICFMSYSERHFTYTGQTTYANVKGITINVSPTVQTNRQYSWSDYLYNLGYTSWFRWLIANSNLAKYSMIIDGQRKAWSSYRDLQSMCEVKEINVFEPVPSGDWHLFKTISISPTYNSPVSLSLKQIIDQNGLLPPVSAYYAKAYYNITLGDTQMATPVDANKYISYYMTNGSSPLKLPNANTDKSTFKITYTDMVANNYNVVATTSEVNCKFAERFAVTDNGCDILKILPFTNLDNDSMWCPRINNGRNVQEDVINNILYDYTLKDFQNQPFDPYRPIMTVKKDQAQIINSNQIRLRNVPMAVQNDDLGNPTNLFVYTKNGLRLTITDWNIFTGDIHFSEDVNTMDIVYADYSYSINYYLYKGFTDPGTGQFYYLDLNPLPGHTYTSLDDLTERPSSELIDKFIYIYALPSFTFNKTNGTYWGNPAPSVLGHVIVDKTVNEADILFPTNALVLGKIGLQKTLVPSMINYFDTRSRGGGFKEDYNLTDVKVINNEASKVWDLGSYDGEPYQSNGVVEISIPKDILWIQGATDEQNKGKFTEDQIRNIINQHVAFGTQVFINYVNVDQSSFEDLTWDQMDAKDLTWDQLDSDNLNWDKI